MAGRDGFKKILGTKVHVAVDGNGLPVSTVCSAANEHGSTRFIDTMENIPDFLDDSMAEETVTVYAGKGYGAKCIGNYLRSNGIGCCIPYGSNSKLTVSENPQKHCSKTRYVAERFFGRLKNGFHGTRTRCEGNCSNYLGLVDIASSLMYCRVLR